MHSAGTVSAHLHPIPASLETPSVGVCLRTTAVSKHPSLLPSPLPSFLHLRESALQPCSCPLLLPCSLLWPCLRCSVALNLLTLFSSVYSFPPLTFSLLSSFFLLLKLKFVTLRKFSFPFCLSQIVFLCCFNKSQTQSQIDFPVFSLYLLYFGIFTCNIFVPMINKQKIITYNVYILSYLPSLCILSFP